MSDVEPDFGEDKDEMQQAVEAALDELSDVKAYTLKADELQEFKAAHYALRNLADPESYNYDLEEVLSGRDYNKP